MRITRRDSRSLIKLSVIDVDIENDLQNLSLWYEDHKFSQEETVNDSSPGEQEVLKTAPKMKSAQNLKKKVLKPIMKTNLNN